MILLALLPPAALLIYIYKIDKTEKEPKKLLLRCFLGGMIAALPMIIVEGIEDALLASVASSGSVIFALFDGFVVAGLTEEFFKRLFLKKRTWKSVYFDSMFDGVIYAVFVSLGFAALENLFYVLDGGMGVALTRMLTAIPGHASFGVYMGYFYSKAKLADTEGNKADYKKYSKLSLWVPVLLHGLYDSLIMTDESVAGEAPVIIGTIIWFLYVIALYIFTFIFVNRASNDDRYMVEVPTSPVRKIVNIPNPNTWTCSCGKVNIGNYCSSCGSAKPVVEEWTCPNCGAKSHWNYCIYCGTKKV